MEEVNEKRSTVGTETHFITIAGEVYEKVRMQSDMGDRLPSWPEMVEHYGIGKGLPKLWVNNVKATIDVLEENGYVVVKTHAGSDLRTH